MGLLLCLNTARIALSCSLSFRLPVGTSTKFCSIFTPKPERRVAGICAHEKVVTGTCQEVECDVTKYASAVLTS